MNPKKQQTQKLAKLLAELIEGTEAFWYNNEKWLIHDRQVMLLTEAPVRVQDMIVMIFLRDKKSRDYLEKMGYNAFSKGFDRWYKCVLGTLDETPDFADVNLNADVYNQVCSDYKCPHRGKFCNLQPGLRSY